MRRISCPVLFFPIVYLFISHFDSISPCYMAHDDIHTYNFCLCSPAHTNALSTQLKAAQSIIMTSACQLLLLLSYVQLGEACLRLQWCFLPTMRSNVPGQWSSAWCDSCWGEESNLSWLLRSRLRRSQVSCQSCCLALWLHVAKQQFSYAQIHSADAGIDRVGVYLLWVAWLKYMCVDNTLLAVLFSFYLKCLLMSTLINTHMNKKYIKYTNSWFI